jgi:hypothetical protein
MVVKQGKPAPNNAVVVDQSHPALDNVMVVDQGNATPNNAVVADQSNTATSDAVAVEQINPIQSNDAVAADQSNTATNDAVAVEQSNPIQPNNAYVPASSNITDMNSSNTKDGGDMRGEGHGPVRSQDGQDGQDRQDRQNSRDPYDGLNFPGEDLVEEAGLQTRLLRWLDFLLLDMGIFNNAVVLVHFAKDPELMRQNRRYVDNRGRGIKRADVLFFPRYEAQIHSDDSERKVVFETL